MMKVMNFTAQWYALCFSLASLATTVQSTDSGQTGRHHVGRWTSQNSYERLDRGQKHADHIVPRDLNYLADIGIKAPGTNPTAPTNFAWIGDGGQWTNEFYNQGAEAFVLVVWGPAGSWVNVIQPKITITIPPHESRIISFATGASGAWAPVFARSKLVNGQVFDTWGEFTFGRFGVVDVSREVNSNGTNMRIEGPSCTADMLRCAFVCDACQPSCWQSYSLLGCENGSQMGATKGRDQADKDSGGCGGMGDTANLKTYIAFAGDASIPGC